jgi:hypothetical protein
LRECRELIGLLGARESFDEFVDLSFHDLLELVDR